MPSSEATSTPAATRRLLPSRIAFAGYASAGKDEAANVLQHRFQYERRNLGDIIKAEVCPIIRKHFGFSAFTEDRAQKRLIRRTLEAWGEDRYFDILEQFFDGLPNRCVNTRLVRVNEAQRWVHERGVIVLLSRPGFPAATEWESERLRELQASNLIHMAVTNDGSVIDLHANLLETLGRFAEGNHKLFDVEEFAL